MDCPDPSPAISLPSEYAEVTDQELLDWIRDENPVRSKTAWLEVHNRYARDIWVQISRKVFDRDDAQDIYASVWLIAVTKLSDPKFELTGKNRSIGAWLIGGGNRGVTGNQIKKYFKDQKRRRAELNEWPEIITHSSTANPAIQSASAEAEFFQRLDAERKDALTNTAFLMRAINQIKNRNYRKVLIAYYIKEWPVQKIAHETKTQPNTASKTLSRARKKLFPILERMLGGGQ